tara:strand:+ start:278 stop:553 length:276 start_codon:yes stop_codon:yes gene_type:complete
MRCRILHLGAADMNVDFGVVELIMMLIMGVLGYLWKTQASDVRRTALDLNKLNVKFAEAKGAAESNNKTLFSHIEEIKEAIARLETIILNK